MKIQEMLAEKVGEISESYQFALGYPANRTYAFDITKEMTEWTQKGSNLYLNNIASPYWHGRYTNNHVKLIEVKLIKSIANHLKLHNEFGYVTSGGTEANFTCLWWHRKYLEKNSVLPPVIICSDKCHYSVMKIANQLGIKCYELTFSREADFCIRLKKILQSLCNPVIFVANIGSTIDGYIDDLINIKEILQTYCQNQYRIHADGAIYGLMIPFLDRYKSLHSIFNCTDTLSLSGHKFLGCQHISGVAITKKTYIDSVFMNEQTAVSYVQGAVDIIASGSRSGHTVIELALMVEKALSEGNCGKTQLEELWYVCVSRAEMFYQEILSITGQNSLLHFHSGQLSIVIPAPKNEVDRFYLGEKYSLMPVGDKQFGIYVFPDSSELKLNNFLLDYKRFELCR